MKKGVKNRVFILVIIIFLLTSFLVVKNLGSNTNSTSKITNQTILHTKNEKEENIAEEIDENIQTTEQTIEEKVQVPENKTEKSTKENSKKTNTKIQTAEQSNEETTDVVEKNTTEEQAPILNEIPNIKFEKDYVKFPIVGDPPNQFSGNNTIVVLPNTPLYVTLNELLKANELIINSSDSDDEKITWTSSNEKVAIFEEKKLAVYSFGTTTITATTESGLSASYTLKIISKLQATGYINRDFNYKKYPAQYAVVFKLSYGSKTYCTPGKNKYDVKMTLYKNGEKIQTEEYKTNSSYLEIYYNDEEGTYYGEYTITDLCSDYTITGKTQEKTITHKKAEETESQ